MNESNLKLRQNVAGILIQADSGKILICERYNSSGAWQFPQGGVDDGETHEEAITRELNEEISLLHSVSDFDCSVKEPLLSVGHHQSFHIRARRAAVPALIFHEVAYVVLLPLQA